MKNIFFVFSGIILFATACSTTNDHLQQLSSMKTDKIITRNKGATSSKPISLPFNEMGTGVLDDKDRSIILDPATNIRSYYELFEAKSNSEVQFVETHTWPSKAAFTFDAITILSPYAIFYDSKGNEIKSTRMVQQKEAHTFIDGTFLRTVWIVSNLRKGEKFYVLIASQNEHAGKKGGTYTNYSGASVSPALISSSQVPFGPTGPFKILYTDKFKK